MMVLRAFSDVSQKFGGKNNAAAATLALSRQMAPSVF